MERLWQFVDEKWRDLVALLILTAGITVGLTAQGQETLSGSLVAAALALLKLPTKTKEDK